VLGRMLALGLSDGRLMLVDQATGELKWAVQAHDASDDGSQITVAMSPDGRFVASVSFADGHWKLWNAANGAVHRVGAMHGDGTGACICSELDLETSLLKALERCPAVAHTTDLRAVAFSGEKFATGDMDGAVILWDTQTGKAEQRMQGFSSGMSQMGLSSISFSVEGTWLASGNDDGSIHVWEAASGSLLRTLHGAHNNDVFGVRFSPTEGRTLVSVGEQEDRTHKIQCWDIDLSMSPFTGETSWCRIMEAESFAEFSPDGRTMAISERYNEVKLIDISTGTVRLTINYGGGLHSLSWSVDGSKLAAGFMDGDCSLWDTSTGALLRNIKVEPVEAGIRVSVMWGRDWVRDTQRGVAFAMGHHPRLGERSAVLPVEEGVLRLIMDLDHHSADAAHNAVVGDDQILIEGQLLACGQVIACPSKGCREQCQRGGMKVHLMECGYAEVMCLFCDVRLRRKDKRACSHRKDNCPNEGCREKCARRSMNLHRAKCGHEEVTCPCPGCDARLLRKDIDAHIAATHLGRSVLELKSDWGQIAALEGKVAAAESEQRRAAASPTSRVFNWRAGGWGPGEFESETWEFAEGVTGSCLLFTSTRPKHSHCILFTTGAKGKCRVHATIFILDKHDKALRHVYELGTATAPTELNSTLDSFRQGTTVYSTMTKKLSKHFTPTAEEKEKSVRADGSIRLRVEVRLFLDGAALA